jgi:hypothetical protein
MVSKLTHGSSLRMVYSKCYNISIISHFQRHPAKKHEKNVCKSLDETYVLFNEMLAAISILNTSGISVEHFL